jgi:hypothetical protein
MRCHAPVVNMNAARMLSVSVRDTSTRPMAARSWWLRGAGHAMEQEAEGDTVAIDKQSSTPPPQLAARLNAVDSRHPPPQI